MPHPRDLSTGALQPISSVLAQATSTTTTALTIPVNCKVIQIVGATVKHYIRLSSANTDDCSASNSAILQVGGEGETLYPHRAGDAARYLLVEATASTGTVDVSFYK
jgi:hypothetical protein